MAQALRIEAIESVRAPAAPPARRARQPLARQLRLAEPGPAHRPAASPAPRPVLRALPGRADAAPVLGPAELVRAVVGAAADLEALPVTGAGMPDALLTAGDVVMIQRGAGLTDGGLHAVLVPGHAGPVLRRLYLDGERLRLQPENRAYAAEEHARSSVRVVGRVVATVRHQA